MLAASKAYARRQAALPRPAHFDPGGSNGSLMRCGPTALPLLGRRDKIAEAARAVSDLTHADAYCGDSAVLWSLGIDRAIELGEKFTPGMVADGLEFIPAVRRQFWKDVIDAALSRPPSRFRQNGSAIGCFACALSAVAHGRDLEHGLQLAVRAGGDTDTTASVAGALLGAWHGALAVPSRWRKAIHGWPGWRARDLERLALEAAGGDPRP